MVLELHSVGFCQVEVYFKVCFEVRKIRLPFFSCQSLLLGTNVPNYICVAITVFMYAYCVNVCTYSRMFIGLFCDPPCY